MSENQGNVFKPAIKLHGSDFIVELDADLKIAAEGCELRVNCHDASEFTIRCKQHTENNKVQFRFPILSIRIPSLIKAQLLLGEDFLDLTAFLLRYQLDKNRLNDKVYLNDSLFNAGVRKLSNEGLFVTAYAYLNTISIDNPYYGGLITLLSYRIADHLADRADMLDVVYATYRHYRDKVALYDADAFRWFVSSSSALTTVLLSTGAVTQASDVVNGALQAIVNPSFNPMAHQNYALLLFQGGLIKVWNGRYEEGTALFIAAANATRQGIADLLHPKNDWVLGQISDCHKCLYLFEVAYLAAIASSGNKLPPASRFGVIKNPPKIHINFSHLFDRFEYLKKTTPSFFSQALQKMQARQNQVK